MTDEAGPVAPRKKATYVGAPAIFLLEQACQHLVDAYGWDRGGLYLVGSTLERADWRDVDLRYIADDDYFQELFPSALTHTGSWEFDPRWLLLTTAISAWLKQQTGLPVDFQFQPRTHANERHKGPRNAMGMRCSTKGE